MAIYKTDLETGEIIHLSNAEIKKAIQDQTGWSTAQYQKEYDKLRNKLRNYEATIGQKKPGAVNEELYRIVTRQSTTDLTERQQAILNFTSASTKGFNEKAQSNNISTRLQNIAVDSLIDGSYRQLLNKSDTTRTAYEKWKNEVVRTEKRIDPATGKLETIQITRVEDGISPKEINKFLGGQAKDLRGRQAREYENNRAYYDENDSYPGSD